MRPLRLELAGQPITVAQKSLLWPRTSCRRVPVAPVSPKTVSFMVFTFVCGSGCSGIPTRGAGVAGTPHSPVKEAGGRGQHAEYPLAGVGRRAVEHPGEELRGAPQSLALPGGLPECSPAVWAQVCLDEGQCVVFLVLH